MPKNSLRLPRSNNSENVHFIVLILFIVVVSLTGGGSRDDILSLILLRPIAILFGAYAFLQMRSGDLQKIRIPLGFLASLSMLLVIQLVPLPPDLWTALPGRDLVAQIAIDADIEQPWRPISLSPSETLNALMSLTVPIAALFLFSLQSRRRRIDVLVIFISLAMLSAFWGLLQLSGAPDGPLYTYRYTNQGDPVGLFANRNHQAVYLISLFPVIAVWGWTSWQDSKRAKFSSLRAALSITFVIFMVPLVLLAKSRAGVLLGLISVGAAIILALYYNYASDLKTKPQSKKALVKFIGPAMAAIAVLATSLLIYFARSPALDRLFGIGAEEESRLQTLPYLMDMLSTYFPVGSGFGSFEHAYRIFEPLELLKPAYLNQAHNDLLQPIIEGGLVAGLIIFAFLAAFLWRVVTVVRSAFSGKLGDIRNIAIILAMMFMLAASLVDYPLRTPVFMTYFAILSALLFDHTKIRHSVNSNEGRAETFSSS